MAGRFVLMCLLIAALAAGCASRDPERVIVRQPVEVKVPVPVRAEPPDELLAPLAVEPLPQFVTPDDKAATSALTADGEKRLKVLLLELVTRVKAWAAWAKGSGDERAD